MIREIIVQGKKLKIGNNKIAYFEEVSSESNIGIIIVHGLAEHKGRYIELIGKLNALKYSVFALDLIGHGESSGPRGDIKNFMDYVKELKDFILEVKQKHPSMKIVLFGHSLGGLIAANYASEHKDIDLLILSNPLLERKSKMNIFNFIPYKLLSFIKIKKRHSESKEMLEISRQDPLACKYMTLRLLGEMFITGINHASQSLSKIKVPLLLLGGSEDPLVKSKNFSKLINLFGSQDKTLKIYEGVRHRLVHSPRKEEVIKDISIWINERCQ